MTPQTVRLLTEPRIESVEMPENLAVALMVHQQRMACESQGCKFDIVHYAFGGSPFPVPDSMVESVREHAGQGEYLPPNGIPPLREAIAKFWAHHFSLDVDPDRVIVTAGSKLAIYLTLAMLQGPFLLPQPSWVGYLPIARLLDKEVRTVPTSPEGGYRLTAAGLEEVAAAAGVPQSILILNTPNNPTGAVYSKEELTAIAEVCRRYNIIVICDEIYSLLTFDASEFVSMASIYPEGTFVTSALSKYAGAGGYRVGFVILPETGTDEQLLNFQKVGAATYTNAPSPLQFAAIAGWGLDDEMSAYIEAQRNMHRMMTTELYRRFLTLPGVTATEPAGSFYFFADFNALGDKIRAAGMQGSKDVAGALFGHPLHVAMVSGEALAMPPANLTFRIAAVDYDGKAALSAYQASPPRTPEEEAAFIERHAAPMMNGVERIRGWIDAL